MSRYDYPRERKGGKQLQAIGVHGQEDRENVLQRLKSKPYKAKPRPYCDRCRSYFCPHVAPHLYQAPFTRGGANELSQALRDWEARWSG